jgi:sec-independent protein translocase protein TatA
MFGLGMPELVLILLVVLFFFGASRLPPLGRSIGDGIRGLREGLQRPKAHSRVEPTSSKSD